MRPNVRAKVTAKADADWPRKDDTHWTWSGQAVFAVAGRRLSEGLGLGGSLDNARGADARVYLCLGVCARRVGNGTACPIKACPKRACSCCNHLCAACMAPELPKQSLLVLGFCADA